ncbi:putative transcription factor tau subunit sfc1 [Diaporthe ampelina]|uniref:Putative transcription factor tau subunit sfc1 n=1 Tax=Diaporthe ampelina TaxID=1214573 RepID=A0A0G2IG89_9PEZI|nr:putative transcription factor tau subunit sfc1 [Diaporthe ampelina]
MADFNYSMKNNEFMNDFSDKILSGDVSMFRQFSMKPGVDRTPQQAIVAPPLMTQISVPYYYFYSQNPYVRVVNTKDGGFEMINTTSRVKSVGYFIGTHDPIPDAPTGKPRVKDPLFDVIVKAMRKLLDERPVWTRRSIINKLTDFAYDPEHPEKRFPPNLSQQLLKNAIQYAGYQFKGGPWRDALCRYGYDPREDPSSRVYQCLIFRLRRLQVGEMGEMWQELRKRDISAVKATNDEHTGTHLFDGKTYHDDGKVWQVCDITDPLLAKLFAEAPIRPKCDIEGSGWYHRGLWAKARAIMKCKMRAIQFGRVLQDSDFNQALQARDDSPDPEATRSIAIPTPDLKLTEKELELIRGKKYKGVGRIRHNKRTSYHFPGKRVQKGPVTQGEAGEPSQSQEGDGDETALEDDQDAEYGDEMGVMDGLPTDFEDGSEYDEDDGDDDDEEFEEEDYAEDDDDDAPEQSQYQAFQDDEDEEQGLEDDDVDG